MGDDAVAPDYSPRRDEAYEYLVSRYPESSDVAITMAGQAIEIGPRRPPDKGTVCRLRVAIVSTDEVNFVVGNTQVEQASRKPLKIQDLLEGVVAWIEAARTGTVSERIATKNGCEVKSVVTGFDQEGHRFRASEMTAFLPWGLAWEEIHYVAYPPASAAPRD